MIILGGIYAEDRSAGLAFVLIGCLNIALCCITLMTYRLFVAPRGTEIRVRGANHV